MPTKTKPGTMFGGVVLEEVMAVDHGIIWCWQKALPGEPDRVVRVTAVTGESVAVYEDRIGKTPYSAIYLDDDCIAAINHARSLTCPAEDHASDPSTTSR